jgi:MoaA/NifB/PqqE/SkfB family radical SAM enzyme
VNKYNLNEIKIEVTYNCPLSCVHCSSDANPGHQISMPVEKCIEIIKDAVSVGVNEVTFSGGEPLVWSGILDVVRYSKQYGLKVNIYTSGNFDNMEDLMSGFANVGVDSMIFSIYSDIEKEHSRVTRKANSFSNTMKAIRLAQSYSIHTEIHFVALASLYKNLPNIAELAKENGVQRISILRFVPQGRGTLISNHDTLSKTQNLELKNIIDNLRKKDFDIRTGSPFNVLFLIGYKSARYLLKRLQTAMLERDWDYMLSGIVELDDAFFGAPPCGLPLRANRPKATFRFAKSAGRRANVAAVQIKLMFSSVCH